MKNNIKLLEDSILINNKILVIGDLHLGYEEVMGDFSLIPKFQYKETLEKLNRIFSRFSRDKIKPEKIIILGDLKHEFSRNINSEWRETLKLLDFLKDKCKEIVIVRGNHDNYLMNILEKRGIKLLDFYKYKEFCFFHGDIIFNKCNDCEILIVGHLHPAITLSDSYKCEKYKCFLKGELKGKLVYIVPSFIPISLGYDLSNIKSWKDKKFDFIISDKELKKFEVIIYNEKEDKIYLFGKLGKIVG
ncbi:metallophosphoesterase [Candidatus Pacearchaeota archaeon]|nr:metallophosphoesterase [Candidatus Pacearchaeota archaeon]